MKKTKPMARRNKKLPRDDAGPHRVQKVFYVDPNVSDLADARAAKLGKSFSAYVNDLVEKDLADE